MELNEIAAQFEIEGKILSIEPYGNGHINRTYLLKTNVRDYILQRINTYAFKDPDMLMNNIHLVTEYLASIHVETMTVVNTKSGKYYFRDGEDCYRIYVFNTHTEVVEKVTSNAQVYQTASAFALFHKDLAGLDASKIGEVIAKFHDTEKRYHDFLDALNQDALHLAATAKEEIRYIKDHEKYYSLIVDALAKKEMPLRITHNDPKINNVLFDEKTHEVRVVIDLDTIMPGSALYDIGDALRSLQTGENESSTDLSLLKYNEDIFRNYIAGYCSVMKDELTEKEKELLVYAPYLMTIECGMRFLEDYLRGNVYFHVNYDSENLIRCRTQIALADDMLKHIGQMQKVVDEVLGK